MKALENGKRQGELGLEVDDRFLESCAPGEIPADVNTKPSATRSSIASGFCGGCQTSLQHILGSHSQRRLESQTGLWLCPGDQNYPQLSPRQLEAFLSRGSSCVGVWLRRLEPVAGWRQNDHGHRFHSVAEWAGFNSDSTKAAKARALAVGLRPAG